MSQHPYAPLRALMSVAMPEEALQLTQRKTHLHPLQHVHHISFWSEPHLSSAQEEQPHHAYRVLLRFISLFPVSLD